MVNMLETLKMNIILKRSQFLFLVIFFAVPLLKEIQPLKIFPCLGVRSIYIYKLVISILYYFHLLLFAS